MSEPQSEFWQSGLPFISNAEGKRVDWTDVGLFSIGAVSTSIYTKIAQTIETLWDVVIIERAQDISSAYSGFVEGVFDQGIAALSFDAATSLASDTGFIGALVIVAVGGYLIAWVIGVIRDG